MSIQINQTDFYEPYHGHNINDLIKVYAASKSNNVDQIIWLAGDSTLDNKYWIRNDEQKPATHIYDKLLDKPFMIQDVAYHINTVLDNKQLCINTSIEATTLDDHNTKYLDQDILIRKYMTDNDILIVSCGGNDILFNQLTMLPKLLQYSITGNIDFFYEIFHNKLKTYIKKLTAQNIPKQVIVCMLYYPDFGNPAGWASTLLTVLKTLGAETMICDLIQKVYRECVSKIKISGVDIKYCPLYVGLDGTNSNDYVSGVEPSVSGGRKLALLLRQYF